MEDENQRRTWEYLQGMTRKDSSYGKILSDAFVAAVDGKTGIGTDKTEVDFSILNENAADNFEEMLEKVLEEKFHEMLSELQEAFAEQISKGFREYAPDFHSGVDACSETDGMEQMHEPELFEDMMAFAFAMGE